MSTDQSAAPSEAAGAHPDPWVELRVHGVSGTPPESILLSAFVTQVAGNDRGRFFRPADSLGRERPPIDGRTLEAYHWGRFTSGSWTQALWLLIIPFGIVNAAQFTLPRPRGRWTRLCHATAGAALRTVGLGLTCLLVFSSVETAMDLLAWQVLGAGTGGNNRWWLLAGLAPPVGVLLLFYWFGQTNTAGQNPGQDRHNEPKDARSQSEMRSDPWRSAASFELDSELARDDFFSGDPDAPTLRRLHGAAVLHMLTLVTVWPEWLAGSGPAAVGRLLAFILLGLAAVTVFFLGDPERDGGVAWWHKVAAVVAGPQLVVGVVLLIYGAVLIALRSDAVIGQAPGVTADAMPGINMVAVGLFLVVIFGLGLLLLASVGLSLGTRPDQKSSRDRAFRRFAGGLAGWILGSIGTYLGVGFAAAFTFAARASINRMVADKVTVTPILQRVAYAWGLTILLIVALAVVGVVTKKVRNPTFVAAAKAAFLFPPGSHLHRLPRTWIRRVASAMFLARAKNYVAAIFALLAVYGLVLSLAAGGEQLCVDILPGCDPNIPGILGRISDQDSLRAGWLMWLGTIVLSGVSIGLVILGRGALRAEKSRRTVNIVWDVVAFWPRAAHPFVPPPYSQHVVAGLRRRISWHLGTLDDSRAAPSPPGAVRARVVVAAHSQGTLITAAALLWLTPGERERVGLVTCGSQLRNQFARAFPAAVDLDVLDWLWKGYGQRWRNLYRDTDPIAGPVLSWEHTAVEDPARLRSVNFGNWQDDKPAADTVDPITGRRICGPDWRLLDPTPHDRALMGGPVFATHGHSDYPGDVQWPLAVSEVLPAPPTTMAPGGIPEPRTADATESVPAQKS